MTESTLAALDFSQQARAAASLLSGDVAVEFHGAGGPVFRSAPQRTALETSQVEFSPDGRFVVTTGNNPGQWAYGLFILQR